MPVVDIKNFKFPPSGLPKRDQACLELVVTEQKYINQIETLIHLYLDPIRNSSSQLLVQEEINQIFANIEIILEFNKELLRSLYGRLSSWGPLSTIGDVMAAMSPYFKCYTLYCNGYDTGREILAAATEERPKLAAFLERSALNPSAKGLSLQSFLIQPVQRIPRYVLLISEILKHTPEDHPDFKLLHSALSKIKEIATIINQRLKEAEIAAKIIELQKMIELDSHSPKATDIVSSALIEYGGDAGVAKLSKKLSATSQKGVVQRLDSHSASNSPISGFFSPRVGSTTKIQLVRPHRRLVLDHSPTLVYIVGSTGVVNMATFFLFNDVLVWAEPDQLKAGKHKKSGPKHMNLRSSTLSRNRRFFYRGFCDLGVCWVNNLPNSPYINGSMMMLVTPWESYTFIIENDQEKLDWLMALSNCVHALITRRPHLIQNRGPIQVCETPINYTPPPSFIDNSNSDYLIDLSTLPLWDFPAAKKALPTAIMAKHYCPSLLAEGLEDLDDEYEYVEEQEYWDDGESLSSSSTSSSPHSSASDFTDSGSYGSASSASSNGTRSTRVQSNPSTSVYHDNTPVASPSLQRQSIHTVKQSGPNKQRPQSISEFFDYRFGNYRNSLIGIEDNQGKIVPIGFAGMLKIDDYRPDSDSDDEEEIAELIAAGMYSHLQKHKYKHKRKAPAPPPPKIHDNLSDSTKSPDPLTKSPRSNPSGVGDNHDNTTSNLTDTTKATPTIQELQANIKDPVFTQMQLLRSKTDHTPGHPELHLKLTSLFSKIPDDHHLKAHSNPTDTLSSDISTDNTFHNKELSPRTLHTLSSMGEEYQDDDIPLPDEENDFGIPDLDPDDIPEPEEPDIEENFTKDITTFIDSVNTGTKRNEDGSDAQSDDTLGANGKDSTQTKHPNLSNEPKKSRFRRTITIPSLSFRKTSGTGLPGENENAAGNPKKIKPKPKPKPKPKLQKKPKPLAGLRKKKRRNIVKKTKTQTPKMDEILTTENSRRSILFSEKVLDKIGTTVSKDSGTIRVTVKRRLQNGSTQRQRRGRGKIRGRGRGRSRIAPSLSGSAGTGTATGSTKPKPNQNQNPSEPASHSHQQTDTSNLPLNQPDSIGESAQRTSSVRQTPQSLSKDPPRAPVNMRANMRANRNRRSQRVSLLLENIPRE